MYGTVLNTVPVRWRREREQDRLTDYGLEKTRFHYIIDIQTMTGAEWIDLMCGSATTFVSYYTVPYREIVIGERVGQSVSQTS